MPEDFADKDLTPLDLRFENLTALPRDIWNRTNLTKLRLNSNFLKKLPPEIGNLTKLTELAKLTKQIEKHRLMIMEGKTLATRERNCVKAISLLKEVQGKKLDSIKPPSSISNSQRSKPT